MKGMKNTHVLRKTTFPKTKNGSGNEAAKKEPIQVFCRIRPLHSPRSPSCMTVISNTVVQLSQPETSTAPALRNGIAKDYQYTFRQVFEESTNQKALFNTVALPLVENLLQGKNGLLFTYGVTGSGKTYTMTGTTPESGIMPRCLDVIFNSIVDKQARKHTFKPDRLNGFEVQMEADAMLERQHDFISNIFIAKNAPKKPTKYNSDPDLANRIVDSTKIEVSTDQLYSVFVTYVEVYNNSVYDLLDENKTLQNKIIREDSERNMYIHGVTEVEVNSTEEAFEVFCKGQKRKRMEHTLLNAESSRSHSIFNIRLVQIPTDWEDAASPARKTVIIAQLSLVDLAGSERTNRTKNTGQRLREAGNINNSLMTLRSCLELLRENQNTENNKIIPYRESKLTHLFKNYFEGDGRVSMIVCVNPRADDYDENLHVLKFAEMSQEVQVTCPTPHRFNLFTPTTQSNHRKLAGHRRRAVVESEESENDLFVQPKKQKQNAPLNIFIEWPCLTIKDIEDDALIPRLTDDLKTKLLNFNVFAEKHEKTRRMLEDTLFKSELDSGMVVAENNALKSRLKREQSKINSLESKVASYENQVGVMKRKLDDCDFNVKKLKVELSNKDYIINKKDKEGEKVKEIYSNKIARAKNEIKSEFEKKLLRQKSALEIQMRTKENKLEEVKRILSDENIPKTPSLSSVASSHGASSARLAEPVATPVTINHRAGPGITHSARKMGVAVSNRRHRRSRSMGDVWLEHKPAQAVPLNTVMQPIMKKRKSVTKLTDIRDVTENTSKYCLMTQNQDSDGDLETRLYKGDVIPTAGGGAQVMFNDVEVLKQISPNVTISPTRRRSSRKLAHSRDVENICSVAIEGHKLRSKV